MADKRPKRRGARAGIRGRQVTWLRGVPALGAGHLPAGCVKGAGAAGQAKESGSACAEEHDGRGWRESGRELSRSVPPRRSKYRDVPPHPTHSTFTKLCPVMESPPNLSLAMCCAICLSYLYHSERVRLVLVFRPSLRPTRPRRVDETLATAARTTCIIVRLRLAPDTHAAGDQGKIKAFVSGTAPLSRARVRWRSPWRALLLSCARTAHAPPPRPSPSSFPPRPARPSPAGNWCTHARRAVRRRTP